MADLKQVIAVRVEILRILGCACDHKTQLVRLRKHAAFRFLLPFFSGWTFRKVAAC